ncbi:hypothetical protein PtA15_4A747 [Puccinia triticina]|uniref:Uncharacterized protein n=1 Tax=Puccinia triticina TaxID=208348 RepID=A0ABY7CHZ3_9BASI|nr:uncharacterized protein PtA15_4A747 [Puccinia triticina]WAQ84294.1 hypothetical protein PtA15_4A747 [Puccinia triticina]
MLRLQNRGIDLIPPHHLLSSLCREWAPHKIRCNSISPGYMNTLLIEKFDPLLKKVWFERTPVGQMGHVLDLNGAALYLASHTSLFTMGTDLLINGSGNGPAGPRSTMAQDMSFEHHNASKAGIIHLMKSLAAEWAPHKIRCNSISPGYMNTLLIEKFDPLLKKVWFESTPVGRMGHVSDLNGAALYLASDASSFTTGTDLLINGSVPSPFLHTPSPRFPANFTD